MKNPVDVVSEWPLMQNISSEVTFDRQKHYNDKNRGSQSCQQNKAF